ncbi:MAG: isoamylase early set domain-containing protein [Burkholderiales bacterium]
MNTTVQSRNWSDQAPLNPIELIGGMQSVRFEFTDPAATTVCVAGSFNNWDPETKPMAPFRNGGWIKETSLAPGTYEYCLVVDGKYIPDPLALETVPNPFGGRNSVLRVYGSEEDRHLDRAEHSPLKNR